MAVSVRNAAIADAGANMLFLEFEHRLATERTADAVREGTEVGAREVALIVARVEMVRKLNTFRPTVAL